MKKQKILCVLLAIILLSSIFSVYSFASSEIQNNQTNTNENSNSTINNNENNNSTISNIDSNTLNDLNKQKDETQEKLEEVNSQLEYVQSEMSNTVLEIQKLDDKIRQYEEENKELETKLQELEKSIEDTTIELQSVSQEYEKKAALLKKRLVALYEDGDISYLDVLLSTSSLSDFLTAYYAMIEMAEYDNKLIDKVQEQKKQIELANQKLQNETGEVKLLKLKAEQNTIISKNTRTLQQGYIKQLSENENKLNSQIQTYKNQMVSLEAQIQSITMQNSEFNIQFTGGKMLWPVAVTGTGITSYFGSREHPIAGVIRFHQGIDIGGTGYGAPAIAAADGVVTYAGELGSYGNCVMIYHGDGITTLYGHGQSIVTKVGAEVKQGDVIMKTGSTGNSTGPHLHFEVRVNKTPVNPLNYVIAP